MKKIFFLVAVIGLAFASCSKDKDDLVVSSKVNSPAKTDKSSWISTSKNVIIEDGEKFMEYTNSISKQKVYLSLGETAKAASKYNKASSKVWIDEGNGQGYYVTECTAAGDNCYNTVVVGPGGDPYVIPHVKTL
jgi:hypothetical protein